MMLTVFQSFIVISHAKMLLHKYDTMVAAKYLAKNGICFSVAKLLILGK
jgi:hypothetical protein